jgi:hypothetical protein
MAQYRFKNMSVAFVKVKKAGKAAPPKTIDNGGIKKRHGRTICDKGHCDVRIKITRILEAFPPTVTIERLDENTHRHTLERTHVEPADEDLYKAISIYGLMNIQ